MDAEAPVQGFDAPASPAPERLLAVYEASPSPEALEHQVWTGRVRSDPVPLDGPGTLGWRGPHPGSPARVLDPDRHPLAVRKRATVSSWAEAIRAYNGAERPTVLRGGASSVT